MNINFMQFIRRQRKNPVYSFISLTGLIIGITVSLISFLWIDNEFSFDRFHSKSENIYRIIQTKDAENDINKNTFAYIPLASSLKNYFPEIENSTFIKHESKATLKFGNIAIQIKPAYTDENFFNIFDGFLFIEGSAKTAFKKSKSAVISETTAQKLFGNEPAVGKQVTVVNDDETYTISAVVRLPKQTHLDFGMITLIKYHSFLNDAFSNNWERTENSNVYVQLFSGTDYNAFQEKIKNYIARFKTSNEELSLQSLLDIHLHSKTFQINSDKNLGDYKSIWIFSGLALFVLIMSVVNYLILFVVRAAGRSIETSIRIINGASRFKIVSQFVSESLYLLTISTLFSLLIVYFSVPFFNDMFDNQTGLNANIFKVVAIILSIFLILIISVLLTSFYLSSPNPTVLLKERKVSVEKNRFVKSLVITQFAAAIFLVLTTTFLIRQFILIENKNLGFNTKNIIVIDTDYWPDKSVLKAELLKNPNIQSVSASVSAPIDFVAKGRYPINQNGKTDSIEASFLWVDEDFAITYQLEIIKGEFLSDNDSDPMKEQKIAANAINEGKNYSVSIPVVINQTAVKLFGFDDPIGKRFGNYIIKGVVNDFNFESLRNSISPLIISKFPQATNTLNIRISDKNIPEAIKYINAVFLKLNQNSFVSYDFFDDIVKAKYGDIVVLRNLAIVLSVLALLVSSLGILALSIFLIDRRTKEIGIRKVNGAKISEILVLLNRDFVKWVAIAFIIATPIAYYAMRKWLENFAYKTELSWWIFALAGLLALGIALLTVSFQSWKAATRNPLEALRYE